MLPMSLLACDLQRIAWSHTLLPMPSVLLHLVRVTYTQCPHVGTFGFRPTIIRWQKPLLLAFRQTTLAESFLTARCVWCCSSLLIAKNVVMLFVSIGMTWHAHTTPFDLVY